MKATIGETIICGVAPGWIYVGTIVSKETANGADVEFRLAPCTYIENVSAPWTEVAAEGGRKKITKSSTTPFLDISVAAMLWNTSAPGLKNIGELKAIEGAK